MPDTVEILEEELELEAYKKVSVGGWMGTVLLSAIPVVNVILWLIWAFSAKRASRRTYAAAMLLLTLIFLLLAAAGIYFFGDKIYEWTKNINPEAFAFTKTQ